jgi:hypothetical protein
VFMYPHSITATLSSKSRNTIRRNSAILPAYSFVLGLLALLGWVAIAAGTKPIGLDGKVNPQLVVPQLFADMFPSWFAGVAFAAIAIGAMVPAAIMAISAVACRRRRLCEPAAEVAEVSTGAEASADTGALVRAESFRAEWLVCGEVVGRVQRCQSPVRAVSEPLAPYSLTDSASGALAGKRTSAGPNVRWPRSSTQCDLGLLAWEELVVTVSRRYGSTDNRDP